MRRKRRSPGGHPRLHHALLQVGRPSFSFRSLVQISLCASSARRWTATSSAASGQTWPTQQITRAPGHITTMAPWSPHRRSASCSKGQTSSSCRNKFNPIPCSRSCKCSILSLRVALLSCARNCLIHRARRIPSFLRMLPSLLCCIMYSVNEPLGRIPRLTLLPLLRGTQARIQLRLCR